MKKVFLLLPLVFMAGCALTSSPSAPAEVSQLTDTPLTDTSPLTFGTSTLTLVSESASSTSFAQYDEAVFAEMGVVPYSFTIKTITEYWKQPAAAVTVSYPIMTYPNNPKAAEAFNTAVRARLDKEKHDFLASVVAWAAETETPAAAETSTWDEEIGESGTINDAEIAILPRWGATGLVSLLLTKATYYSGAVHPTTITESFNFDLDKRKELGLADLFVPKSPYLATLSKLAIADLHVQNDRDDLGLDFDIVNEGASPTAAHFHTVNFSTTGIVITFDTYDVDAYAAGPHEVTIPYAKLKEIMAPDILANI